MAEKYATKTFSCFISLLSFFCAHAVLNINNTAAIIVKNRFILSQFIVFHISDRLKPFVRSPVSRDSNGNMQKLRVGCGTVPMLHLGRNIDHVVLTQAPP